MEEPKNTEATSFHKEIRQIVERRCGGEIGQAAQLNLANDIERLVNRQRSALLTQVLHRECRECANGEAVAYDPSMKHWYHYDGNLGCGASLIHRMRAELGL